MRDLETLLGSLHLARARYETLSARIRTTVDGGVLDRDARRRGMEPHWGERVIESVDHLWFASPERWLLQAESGSDAGAIVGRDGDREIRNFSLDDIGSWPPERFAYYGGDKTFRQVMWEPNLLIPLLWLETVREAELAGRRCVVARALPRPSSTDYVIIEPAQQFELAADMERGVLLRLRRLYAGAVGIEDEVLEIAFDVDVPDSLFEL